MQELKQKLGMAADELEVVRGDLTAQLQQMREATEQAQKECEEQRLWAHGLESELVSKSQK